MLARILSRIVFCWPYRSIAFQHAAQVAQHSRSSDAETNAVETAANALRETLKTLEENEEDSRVMAELGKLLYQKKLNVVDCYKVQHVASAEETRLAINSLLRRRQDFLFQHNITADNYVMTDEQREDIFRIWKDEYHRDPLQQELQMRYSWKEPEKSKGKGKGRATQRTGTGKGRATQLAVTCKSFATGGKTKTVKDAIARVRFCNVVFQICS